MATNTTSVRRKSGSKRKKPQQKDRPAIADVRRISPGSAVVTVTGPRGRPQTFWIPVDKKGNIPQDVAIARLMDVVEGDRHGRERNYWIDLAIDAKTVAPAKPKSDEERLLQYLEVFGLEFQHVAIAATPSTFAPRHSLRFHRSGEATYVRLLFCADFVRSVSGHTGFAHKVYLGGWFLCKDELQKKGWTLAALADELGVTVNAVEKWKAGDRYPANARPTLALLDQIANRKRIPKQRRYST